MKLFKRWLEVKARTDVRRTERMQLVGRVLLLASMVAAGALLWREFRSVILEGWMYQTPMYALREYLIDTDGVLTRTEIEQTASVRLGQNILALDLPVLRDRLKLHPRIEEASVERVLPITVRERIPVARIRVLAKDGVEVHYLLDESGYPMPPLQAGRVSAEAVASEGALPIILGATGNDFSPGRPTLQPDVQAALKFLNSFDRSELAGLTDILSLDLSHRGVLSIVTSHGSSIDLKPENYEQQLRDWQRIWQEGSRLGKAIRSLDLAVNRNIPLRWMETAPAAPTTPADKRPTKPKRIRRNHV
jgi:cell division septal protein FtsQ